MFYDCHILLNLEEISINPNIVYREIDNHHILVFIDKADYFFEVSKSISDLFSNNLDVSDTERILFWIESLKLAGINEVSIRKALEDMIKKSTLIK